jgi:hypothetical protein
MLISESSISLIRGGTLYWAQEQTRLIRPNQWNLARRVTFLIGLAWLPLLILAALHSRANLDQLFGDYRVGSLVFVALPLLLVAQITMENRFREMAQHFLDAGLIPADQFPIFQKIMGRAQRLRDAKLPEILIIFMVYGLLVYLLESIGPRSAAWAMDGVVRTPAGLYFLWGTQPLFLVLLFLVFWKWIIWVVVLRNLSCLRLQLDSTDGDFCAGLGFLGEIPAAFVPAVIAISTVIGATWRMQLLAGRITLQSLIAPACVLAVIVVCILFVPLVLFVPSLVQEKRQGILRYGSLRHLHSLEFRERWLANRDERPENLLGAPEISSLADISTSFNNVESMRPFPFRKGVVLALLVALALPLIPVVTTKIPLRELLKGLLEALH